MKRKLKQESTEVMLGEREEVSAEYRFVIPFVSNN